MGHKYKIEYFAGVILLLFLIISSCKKEDVTPKPISNPSGSASGGSKGDYSPTPYYLPLSSLFLDRLPPIKMPDDNPLTEEGIALGRKLFYDKILSRNGTLSCASCHRPDKAFSDSPNKFSTVGGALEFRNTPPLINLGWAKRLFWDGRVYIPALENQALEPVVNPNEMHSLSWSKVVERLQASSLYPSLFYKAFGTDTIDSSLVVKAIAQFERTLISDDSKMDRYLMGEATLTPLEQDGLQIFMSETGNCFHCHGSPGNPLWTDNGFHDTGLDATYTDKGLGTITGKQSDNGKFKTPTLRNLIYTAPYMHDGRFQTLEEVIEFYSTGIKNSPNLDPNFYRVSQGGAHFTQHQKDALIAFLKTLTDPSFINNPNFKSP